MHLSGINISPRAPMFPPLLGRTLIQLYVDYAARIFRIFTILTFILFRSYTRWPDISNHNWSLPFQSILCWFIQAWREQPCLCFHGNSLLGIPDEARNKFGNQCHHIEAFGALALSMPIKIHHNLFIILLLGSTAKILLLKQHVVSKQKCIDYIEN